MHAKSLQSCLTLHDPMDRGAWGATVHGDSTGKNNGVGCHALLQGIFPTQDYILLFLCSVQFSHSVMSDSLQPHWPQHTRPPCPSPTAGVHPNPCSLNQWCHPTILSSVIPFSSCPQSFPASGSFQMSQLFASGGQSIRVSASTSFLPMNTQDWTGWISLQSKGLFILLIFESLILKLQLKILIYLLRKIIAIHSETICNLVLYFPSLL